MMRNRGLRVVLAAALTILPALPAAALGPDAASSQNVVAASSGEDAATLEARRKQLFAQMLRNPADLDAAFEYAAISSRLGDLEGAISTLERMLIFAPGLSRLQYELGVLYFRLGAYPAAETYLRAVEGAADVPPDAKAQVAAYLAAIEKRSAGSAFSGTVSAGVRYQTNANAGPGSPFINLNGLTFVLSPTAVGQPDANFYLSGTFNGAVDLESQGDRLGISLTGYGTFYRTQGALNTGVVEAKIGPQFNLGRFGMEGSTAGVYGILGGAVAGGGDPYLATAGIGGDVNFGIDARSQLTLRAEGRWETFYNSAARPTVALRTGPDVAVSATYMYALTPNLDVRLTAGLDRHVGQTPWLRSWQANAEAGATLSFASPIEALPSPWQVSVVAGAQRQVSDGPDPMFSLVDPELTTRLYIQGKISVPLPGGFHVEAAAAYIRSLSNYALSNYDNIAVSLGAGKAF